MFTIDLDDLKQLISDVLPNDNFRIQQTFENNFLTFYIDWFDNNGIAQNIGFSFHYNDLINFKGDMVKYLADKLEKEIK